MNLIDLSSLPPPDVVETIDFETIFEQRKAAFLALYPIDQRSELVATLGMESEPITKLLQENAYREILLRQRINDAAKAVMLAYARGADLDNLTALMGVKRLESETDTRLRYRAQMEFETTTVAGSSGSYIAHTLAASNLVKDVTVTSPVPGQVLVTVLSSQGNGLADQVLLQTVNEYLSSESRRPLTDQVIVESASIINFSISATIHTFPGPSASKIIEIAKESIADYVAKNTLLGHDITISGIYASLHQVGVQSVVLNNPVSNIVISERQAAHCLSIDLTHGENDV